jgi:hypothetical protein
MFDAGVRRESRVEALVSSPHYPFCARLSAISSGGFLMAGFFQQFFDLLLISGRFN